MSGPGIEPGTHGWEASALTTPPSLLPPVYFVLLLKTLWKYKNLCLQETLSCRALNNAVHAWHGIRVQVKMTVDKHLAIYADVMQAIETCTKTRWCTTWPSNGHLCGQFLAWCKRKKFDGFYAQYTHKVGDARLDQVMTTFVDNSSLDVSERNSMAFTFNIHTKSHTVVFKFLSVNQPIIFNADRITHTFKCAQDWLWNSI